MDKLAFALMTIILAVYIAAALLLSRVRRSPSGRRLAPRLFGGPATRDPPEKVGRRP
jgi:hypothetical protein